VGTFDWLIGVRCQLARVSDFSKIRGRREEGGGSKKEGKQKGRKAGHKGFNLDLLTPYSMACVFASLLNHPPPSPLESLILRLGVASNNMALANHKHMKS